MVPSTRETSERGGVMHELVLLCYQGDFRHIVQTPGYGNATIATTDNCYARQS